MAAAPARALTVLPDAQRRRLAERAVHSAAQLFDRTPLELVELLDLSYDEVAAMRQAVAAKLAPPCTALELLRAPPRHLPTGLAPLDAALGGGVPTGSITEVVGPAGLGKTQLSLALTATALLGGLVGGPAAASEAVQQGALPGGPEAMQWQGAPQQAQGEQQQQRQEGQGQPSGAPSSSSGGGSEGSVVFVDTESKLGTMRHALFRKVRAPATCDGPPCRMLEIAAARFPEQLAAAGREAVLSRVMVIKPRSSAELLERLRMLDATIMLSRSVRLVVVDSMASLARADFTHGALPDRQRMLGQQASQLKRLAETFSVPVFVTALMADCEAGLAAAPGGAPGEEGGPAQPAAPAGGGSEVQAALGPMWAHAVNTRLMLEQKGGTRLISINKAPNAPNTRFPYHAAGNVVAAPIANEIAFEAGGTQDRQILISRLARAVLAFQDSFLAREGSPAGLLCQVWLPEVTEEKDVVLRTKGMPFCVAGVGDLLALFRCISCRFAFGTAISTPHLLGAPGRVYVGAQVQSTLMLPLFTGADEHTCVGVLEVVQTSEDMQFVEMAQLLGAALEHNGLYTSDLESVRQRLPTSANTTTLFLPQRTGVLAPAAERPSHEQRKDSDSSSAQMEGADAAMADSNVLQQAAGARGGGSGGGAAAPGASSAAAARRKVQAAAQSGGESEDMSEEQEEEEEEDDEDYEAPAKSGKGATSKPGVRLRLEDLQSQFGVGLKEAAARLGICPTTLKRACRRHGIQRWPRRQLQKVNKALDEMEQQQALQQAPPVPPPGAPMPMDAADNRWLTLSQFIPAFQSTYAEGTLMQYSTFPGQPPHFPGLPPATELLGGPAPLGWAGLGSGAAAAAAAHAHAQQQQQPGLAAVGTKPAVSLPDGAAALGGDAAAGLPAAAGGGAPAAGSLSGSASLGQPPSGHAVAPQAVELHGASAGPSVSPFLAVAQQAGQQQATAAAGLAAAQQQRQQQQQQQLAAAPVVQLPGLPVPGMGNTRLSQIQAPSLHVDLLPGSDMAAVPDEDVALFDSSMLEQLLTEEGKAALLSGAGSAVAAASTAGGAPGSPGYSNLSLPAQSISNLSLPRLSGLSALLGNAAGWVQPTAQGPVRPPAH
eukprot:scaffold15.g4335.t1